MRSGVVLLRYCKRRLDLGWERKPKYAPLGFDSLVSNLNRCSRFIGGLTQRLIGMKAMAVTL
jgi:hypothetical protein